MPCNLFNPTAFIVFAMKRGRGVGGDVRVCRQGWSDHKRVKCLFVVVRSFMSMHTVSLMKDRFAVWATADVYFCVRQE